MNQHHENSLLFSLAELRGIEDARIAEEAEEAEAAQAAKVEAERAAQLARERKAAQRAALERAEREHIEQAARSERDQQQREQQREQRREQLALEEAERLARVAAEERLARERLALEVSLAPRPQTKRWPIAVAVAASIACLALSALYVRTAGALTESRQAHAGLNSELKRANTTASEAAAAVADQKQTIDSLRQALTAANEATPAAAPKIQPAASTSRPTRPSRPTTQPKPVVTPRPIELPICRNSNDPLCGLGPTR